MASLHSTDPQSEAGAFGIALRVLLDHGIETAEPHVRFASVEDLPDSRSKPYMYRVRFALVLVAMASCGNPNPPPEPHGEVTDHSPPTGDPPPQQEASPIAAEEPEEINCANPMPIMEDGQVAGHICPDRLAARGLTEVDLSDDWVPFVFLRRDDPDVETVEYRSTFIALANEDQAGAEGGFEQQYERYLEVFGVFPSYAVLKRRAESIGACADEINSQAIANLEVSIRPWGRSSRGARAPALRNRLEQEARSRGLASIEDLADDRRYGPMLRQYHEASVVSEGVAAVQRHLDCEGELIGGYTEGEFGSTTARAVRDWQRKHMIISNGGWDEISRQRMALGVKELFFRSMLRALRERVTDAAGLIEDGSAVADYGSILGRDLDPPELRALAERGPLPNGVRDYISPATEAAARALGWTDPDRAIAAIRAMDTERNLVAIRLPPLPEYHSPHIELRTEIDRGDMRRGMPQEGDHRPTVTIFATHNGREMPILRWSTTIGGWQPEQLEDGSVVRRFKESPAGPVIWRDVVAAPAWLPPPSTPDGELVRGNAETGYRPQYQLFGPGYRSAYGLAMVMHHEPRGEHNGEPYFHDDGIRMHGSVSYRSILTGHSHGCHRVFNHLALRLGSYLLRHRRHIRQGDLDVQYLRVVHPDPEHELTIRLRSRGHLFQLDPPIHVNVLEGVEHESPRRRGQPQPDPSAPAI